MSVMSGERLELECLINKIDKVWRKVKVYTSQNIGHFEGEWSMK